MEGRRGGAGGDALHRHARVRPADEIKQEYFKADGDDIEVNQISPTGYRCGMIKASPGIGDGIRPTARPTATCSTPTAASAPTSTSLEPRVAAHPAPKRVGDGQDLPVRPHAQLRHLDLQPDRVAASRDTSVQRGDGSYQLLSAEHVFRDYQFSTGAKIALPELEAAAGG